MVYDATFRIELNKIFNGISTKKKKPKTNTIIFIIQNTLYNQNNIQSLSREITLNCLIQRYDSLFPPYIHTHTHTYYILIHMIF